MKKLLATLLVAMMIMSCMTVVSFAGGTTVKTASEFKIDLSTRVVADYITVFETGSSDPFVKDYYSALRTMANPSNGFNYTLTSYGMAVNQYFAGANVSVPTEAPSVGDLIAIPFYAEGTGVDGLQVYVNYDENYLTPVVNLGFGDNAKSIKPNPMNGNKDALYVAAAYSAATKYAGSLFFTVNKDAVGDPGLTTATTKLDIDVEYMRESGTNDETISVGTSEMEIKLYGLTPGEAGSNEPEDITEDEVKAITPVVVGTFEATNMVADIKEAYGVDVTLEDEFDAENMSYIPVFASVPTENKNAPAAYGIIISGEGVEELKIPVTNAVDGKFGVVLYGFTGHIEKYTEVSVYVTVGESTYTSALGNL